MSNNNHRRFELETMTTTEARALLSGVKAALIPIGSTEQHGTNMTMNTDTRLAQAMCTKLGAAMYPDLVVLPPISVGVSYHHMAFAGSMTLSPATMQAVLFDYIRSMKKHGVQRFILMNGHGGNQSALSSAATVALHELEVEVVNVFYWNLATEEIQKAAVTERYGHACEIEASFGLYLDPSIVRSDKLKAAKLHDYPMPYSGLEAGPKVDYPYPWQYLTTDGSLGDATAASREKGEALIELIAGRLQAFITSFIARGDSHAVRK